ncbi:hypothetical protein Godav_015237, partial [Gossypium davidsonii]|nr:hypothetical protein [Gossypium davidsonii]
WKLKVPHRVRNFLWLVLRDRFLTNNERVKRGLALDVGCQLCGFPDEDISHVIRNCMVASKDQDLISSEVEWRTPFAGLGISHSTLLGYEDSSLVFYVRRVAWESPAEG